MKPCYILAFLGSLLFWQPLSAQEVWPGDVNNNGVVNAVDLLYWGVAYGSSGPQRSEVSTEWQAQPLPEQWSQNFPDGINYAYADCDGNGTIDDDDFDDAIEDNYGLTHGTITSDGYANATPGAGPRIALQPDADIVQEGAVVNISLSIDDSDMPVDSFYGVALDMSYTTGLLAGDDGPDFELAENSWMEADGSTVEEIFIDNNGQGRAQLAITRTNQQGVAVEAGPIGNFQIVIEDIIVGLSVDTFILRVDSVRLITPNLESILTVPDTTQIIIAKDGTVSASKPAARVPARVYPNPAARHLFIEAAKPLKAFQLINQLGQTLPMQVRTIQNNFYSIQLPVLPPGPYLLSGQNEQGAILRKLIFIHQN